MKLKHIVHYLEAVVPLAWQEDWDKSGLQIGDPEQDIHKVLVALDADGQALAKALEVHADLIVTHHPLFFHPLAGVRSYVPEEKIVRTLLQNNISVYSMHTNLDAAPWGVNDKLARKLGFGRNLLREPLIPLGMEQLPINLTALFPTSTYYRGMTPGFVSLVELPLTRFDLWRNCQDKLQAPCQVNFAEDSQLNLIALSGGSWDNSWLETAVTRGVQAIITGEMRYHEQVACRERGIATYTVGHDVSERQVLPFVADVLKAKSHALAEEEKVEVFIEGGLDYSSLMGLDR